MIDVKRIFTSNGKELHRFEKVKKPMHKRQDLAGLMFLAKLCPGEAGLMITGHNNDCLTLGVTPEELDDVATTEDILTLIRCGILLDKDTNELVLCL